MLLLFKASIYQLCLQSVLEINCTMALKLNFQEEIRFLRNLGLTVTGLAKILEALIGDLRTACGLSSLRDRGGMNFVFRTPCQKEI